MAAIPQLQLFSWEDVEASPEIMRLARVLEVLPDHRIVEALIRQRKARRNDYPIQAVWNSLIAGVVFGHGSVESLRRELARNGELRQVCGFDPLRGGAAVPPAPVYSRVLAKLHGLRGLVDGMFHELVEMTAALLPDFGREVAIDGKALATAGRNDPEAARGGQENLSDRRCGGQRGEGDQVVVRLQAAPSRRCELRVAHRFRSDPGQHPGNHAPDADRRGSQRQAPATPRPN